MIIKSKSIKNRGGIRRTLEYVFKEDKNHTLLLTRFLAGAKDIDSMVKRFENNEHKRLRRRKDSVILFHDFISFHHSDSHKLNDDAMLKQIAKKYALMREQSLTLVVLHREKDHIHIHIVASGCRLDGRSARVSRVVFASVKKDLERFQERELRLVHSRVNHEKKRSN